MLLFGSLEASLRLLRNVSQVPEKAPKTGENVAFGAQQGVGRAGALPRPYLGASGRPLGPPNRPKASQIGSKN